MFFDQLSDLSTIAQKSGCSIFVLPQPELVSITNALVLAPVDKTTITIDQVRQLISRLNTKRSTPQIILVNPADALGEGAGNALLKSLEEPKENYHFALLTKNPSALLPTIRSRSATYILKTFPDFSAPLTADANLATVARALVSASPKTLPALAETIVKKRTNTRDHVLSILAIAIEILTKSYFKTQNPAFLHKLPKFLLAHENISKNGHIKLHLVADLL